ncbi:MAG TPA: chemotaxis protein CheW [Candidatus Acidoferrales bacterium]|nr:chemotaxis protein CheW [Candidatus Acidoferrales bacterium]
MNGHDVLVRRAERLSQSAALLREPIRSVELLCFQIGGERYAIETRFTFSVMQRAKPAALPGTPPHFLGILGVQGEIVPAIDLARTWGRPSVRSEVLSAVILGIDEPEFAIAVDSLDELVRYPEPEIAAAPALDSHHEFVGRLIRGMLLLDGESLLADSRFSIHASAGKG